MRCAPGGAFGVWTIVVILTTPLSVFRSTCEPLDRGAESPGRHLNRSKLPDPFPERKRMSARRLRPYVLVPDQAEDARLRSAVRPRTPLSWPSCVHLSAGFGGPRGRGRGLQSALVATPEGCPVALGMVRSLVPAALRRALRVLRSDGPIASGRRRGQSGLTVLRPQPGDTISLSAPVEVEAASVNGVQSVTVTGRRPEARRAQRSSEKVTRTWCSPPVPAISPRSSQPATLPWKV